VTGAELSGMVIGGRVVNGDDVTGGEHVLKSLGLSIMRFLKKHKKFKKNYKHILKNFKEF
jgi:hypothetical protein